MTRLKQIGKLFPTLKRAVASYDPATFYIYLEDIAEADLPKIRANPFTAANIEHIKTLFHEIRHYVDHVATLWGQRLILEYLKSANIRLQGDIANFKTIIEYKNQENQLFYANYYTEEYNYIPVDRMDRRWQWTTTSGIKFNAQGISDETQPIPFVHFKSFDNVPLMRMPISIASLLETNSTSEEIKWHIRYVFQISEIERPFQLKFFGNETLFKLLYNQDLALYNVAVHLAANILHINDFIEAFHISSAIATLTLNLPNNLVKSIPVKDEKFKAWGNRCQSMLDNNEHGFIYFLLLENYAPIYCKSKKFDIEELLQSSNLPDENAINEQVLTEMDIIIAEAYQLPNLKEVFIPHLENGRGFFKELGICFKNINIENVILGKTPTLICNDTNVEMKSYRDAELFSLRPIKSLSISEWYNVSAAINTKLTQLYEVRGI
jgi:hypothetical protein